MNVEWSGGDFKVKIMEIGGWSNCCIKKTFGRCYDYFKYSVNFFKRISVIWNTKEKEHLKYFFKNFSLESIKNSTKYHPIIFSRNFIPFFPLTSHNFRNDLELNGNYIQQQWIVCINKIAIHRKMRKYCIINFL